jgi:hypothetical protein
MSSTHTGAVFNAFKVLNRENMSHTLNGVGEWWKADLKDGPDLIHSVTILNRVGCPECGDRLGDTLVLVDGQECGQVPSLTVMGQEYTVVCPEPILGTTV